MEAVGCACHGRAGTGHPAISTSRQDWAVELARNLRHFRIEASQRISHQSGAHWHAPNPAGRTGEAAVRRRIGGAQPGAIRPWSDVATAHLRSLAPLRARPSCGTTAAIHSIMEQITVIASAKPARDDAARSDHRPKARGESANAAGRRRPIGCGNGLLRAAAARGSRPAPPVRGGAGRRGTGASAGQDTLRLRTDAREWRERGGNRPSQHIADDLSH